MTNANPPTSSASVEAMRQALKDAASTFEVLQEHLKDDPKLADELPVDLHVAIHETMLACRALSTPAEKTAEREAEIEQAARAISLSYGEDPDDIAPLGKICGPNNEPMPNWTAYREQAAAALSSLSTPAEAGREARKAAEAAASTVISALGDPVKHEAAITAIAAQFEAFALAAALSTPAEKPAGREALEAIEKAAAICEERAAYFDRAPGHRDWTDAARSYRWTAKAIRALSTTGRDAP